MLGVDGNTTLGQARIELLTLTKEAVVEIMLELFDESKELMSRLNHISDKRNAVNHFLKQPDHVTTFMLSYLSPVELGRGTLRVNRSFRREKTAIYMAIRLHNADRGCRDALSIGKRLLNAC